MTQRPAEIAGALEYETEFREEILPDGTVRMSVVIERGRGLKTALTFGGLGLLCSILLGLLWFYTGSARAGVYALMVGPFALILAGTLALIQLTSPGQQTHVVEVNPQQLTIRTSAAGDKITRRHPRDEVVAVTAHDMALDVRTRRDEYSCLQFAKPAHLGRVAQRVQDVLSGASVAPGDNG